MFTFRFMGFLRIGTPPSALSRSSTATSGLATYIAPAQGLKTCRYSSSSSSKPSSPSDGRSRTSIAGTATVRRTSRSGLRGSAGGAAGAKVPVVPSTDHLHPAGMARPKLPYIPFPHTFYMILKGKKFWVDVAVSAFFAQHRPVSISYPFPLTHSSTLFDTIFAPPQSPPASAASSSTISPFRAATVYHASPVASDFETVDVTTSPTTFEAAVRSAHNTPHHHHHHHHHHHYRKQSPPSSPAEEAEGESPSPPEATPTATPANPDFFIYRPFRPPPAPRAQTAFLRPRLRKQFIQLFLRIAASQPSPGSTTVAISGNSKLLLQSMMGQRAGGGAINGQERIFVRLISVKRIRKLKMKKHKLRKLRKRTRSLRRRVESQRK